MHLKQHKLILALVLFFVSLQPIAAQTLDSVATENETAVMPAAHNRNTPSEKQWNDLTGQKDFSYRNEKENAVTPQQKPANPNWFLKMLNAIFGFFASGVGEFILWGLLIAGIAWAVFKLVLGEKTFLFGKSSKKKEEVIVTEEEELMEVNWEQRLQKAIAENNFRLAVRYSYMYMLRILQERQLIDYRNDKTNHDYYSELDNTKFKQPFRQLTRQYEFAWYGGYPLSASGFDQYMQQFQDLKKQIGAL